MSSSFTFVGRSLMPDGKELNHLCAKRIITLDLGDTANRVGATRAAVRRFSSSARSPELVKAFGEKLKAISYIVKWDMRSCSTWARRATHLLTWNQVDDGACYRRHKIGAAVDMAVSEDLAKALAATPRKHVCVITTAYGKPFTVDGFSGWMRDAISKAGLLLDCQPHGLRKTLSRLLADAGCSAHDIMAALGHTTPAEAERYSREADRRRGGKR